MRALAATYLFVVVGLWSLIFGVHDNSYELPHLLFYATLTLNTYFSIRFYSYFTPAVVFQSAIDIALAAAYICLALTIGVPILFALCATIVFTIAPLKYAHMLGFTPYDATLRRKILIDLAGTCMCLSALILTLMGYVHEAAWLLAIVFAIANIHLLIINPMYRHVTK